MWKYYLKHLATGTLICQVEDYTLDCVDQTLRKLGAGIQVEAIFDENHKPVRKKSEIPYV